MGFFNMGSMRKYSMMAVTLLIAALLACGIAGTANAQVSVVSSGGSVAATGPGGSFISSGSPFIGGGTSFVGSGFAPDRMVCYQDPFGRLICERASPYGYDYPNVLYRTPARRHSERRIRISDGKCK